MDLDGRLVVTISDCWFGKEQEWVVGQCCQVLIGSSIKVADVFYFTPQGSFQ